MPGADAFLGKITPGDARAGRSPALGAVVHGQPRTLHVPRAGGASLRPDQHAGAVRRRDRRPGDGLRALLRPQPAHLHPPAGRAPVRAGRRRVGAGEQRDRARDRQRDGPGDDLPARRDDGDRRHGGDRLRDRAAGPGLRDDGPRRRPVSRPGPAARGRRGGRWASTAARAAGLERLRRDRRAPHARDRPARSTPGRWPTCGRPAT